jgi:hypothetical protein
MRFASAVVAILSAGLVPASAGVLAERGQSVVTADLKIPGDSPLELCDKDHSKDSVTIDSVDLVPNPPKAYVVPSSPAARGPTSSISGGWVY